jgi:hypothetical protein
VVTLSVHWSGPHAHGGPGLEPGAYPGTWDSFCGTLLGLLCRATGLGFEGFAGRSHLAHREDGTVALVIVLYRVGVGAPGGHSRACST